MPPEITDLDGLIAFNDQLLALNEAGVPVGFVGNATELAADLEKINSLLARHVGRGDPVVEALETEPGVPSWYRTLALSALKCRDVVTALREFTTVAKSADQSQYVTESALFYPLIVASFAYCGIVGFCFFFVPSLQSAYASFRIPAGSGLMVLELLRNTLPYWIAIPPVFLLLLLVWRIRKHRRGVLLNNASSGLVARFSGATRAIADECSAYLAESIATFDENDIPLDEAIALASGAARPVAVSDPSRRVTSAAVRSRLTSGQPKKPDQFPPFLRWALFDSEPAIARHEALRMAAALYRQTSHDAMRRARIIAPIILVIAIGGTVTLLYGLALFVPVVQMLKAVALAPLKGA